MSCPRCGKPLSQGEPSFCERCEGAWISEQALVERVAAMQHAPAAIEWSTESRTALTCVVCAQPMAALVVFGVPIDRCRPHGFWFDRDELAEVLYVSSQRPRDEAKPISDDTAWGDSAAFVAVDALDTIALTAEIGGSVLDAGALDAAAAGASVVAEASVEAAGGVLEAIGEVLGGLLDLG